MESAITPQTLQHTIARAEELMYDAVNALCHGSIETGRSYIISAIEILETLNAKLDALSDQDQAVLKDISSRALLVHADIHDEAALLHLHH